MIAYLVAAIFFSSCNALRMIVNNRQGYGVNPRSILHMSQDYSTLGPETTPILDSVNYPKDLKRLDMKQLKQLCHELRWDTLRSVSKTGGHLGSSLGVVELTVALHYIFDAPEDKIVWDVAHQAYPHKILTGRRSRMDTMRQLHGLAGFCNRHESEYDCFGAGHSSTSISAALGMSVGKNLLEKKKNNCIAVIGDGTASLLCCRPPSSSLVFFCCRLFSNLIRLFLFCHRSHYRRHGVRSHEQCCIHQFESDCDP